MKRLPYLLFGLLLLTVNLIVPVFWHEFSISDSFKSSGGNSFIYDVILWIPVGIAAIYLVYMRSKDAGKVVPLFWIWLFASLVSISSYFVSLFISASSNSYFYYSADLVCLGIGVYLIFAPSVQKATEIQLPS